MNDKMKREKPVCLWCREVKKLLNHHYPIPESLGGRETIAICHCCHGQDHARYPDDLIQRMIDEIKGHRVTELDLFGEDPHAERKRLIQEAMKREEEKEQLKMFGDEDKPIP